MNPRHVIVREEGDLFADFDLFTVDSAPPRYALKRSPWLPLAFLGVFALVSAGMLASLPWTEAFYRTLLGRLTSAQPLPEAAFSFRLRPFFLSFFVAFSLFSAGTPLRRAKLLLTLVLLFGAVAILLDVALVNLAPFLPSALVAVTANIAVGFGALVIFVGALLTQGVLPEDERVRALHRRPRRYLFRFLGVVLLGAFVAALASGYLEGVLEALRTFGLLGGLGPGIVLFFPLVISLLAVIGMLSLRDKPGDIRYSVAFLVPALNEADNVVACIRSLDRAAERYERLCKLYLVDNGSSDATRALAQEALSRCKALTGVVLSCPEAGKSKALNLGLRDIREDIVVRIDADTQVSPDLLQAAIPHFAEPTVGGVSGLPLPLGTRPLLAKLRAVEVYMNQGFVRLGMSAVDGLLSMTGVFSAYRRSCLEALGGFAEGINGEDTDIALRIGRLGYRLVNDPRLVVYSEVPGSFAELREQRLRWFRSTFHVAARNRSAMRWGEGVRGWFSLPWALVQATRRSVMIPILVYTAVVVLLAPGALYLRAGAAALAVVVGVPFLLNVGVVLAYRRFGLLPYLPLYLGFRLLRSYLGLEMLFTLPLKEGRPR